MPDDRATQQSAQWLRERIGWCTASRMKDVLAKLKNGQPSESRRKYAMELVASRMIDGALDHYVSPAMQWGIDYEADAVAEYEARTGELCDPCGFIPHPRIEFFGATPDRLIGTDGLLEVKCPTTTTYAGWRMAGAVPEEHKPQMLAQLACTGRKYVDFCAYDPRVVDPVARLFVRRFKPTLEQIQYVEAEAEKFLAEVEAIFQAVITGE